MKVTLKVCEKVTVKVTFLVGRDMQASSGNAPLVGFSTAQPLTTLRRAYGAWHLEWDWAVSEPPMVTCLLW